MKKLVIVGDTLLDRDVEGSVSRVAPDAPAPVLEEESVRDRPGGAGLAALLAARQGHDVALITALADDAGGARLSDLLTEAGVAVYPMPLPGATPEKVRLRAGGQVLVRLDRGGAPATPGDPPEAALAVLREAAAILVSDYGRGVTRNSRLRTALKEAHAPIVWDPHPKGPAPVPNVRLATPNQAEAGGADAGPELRRRWRADAVVVTQGARGAVLWHAGSTPLMVPAPEIADGDPCGAGDRFAATAALALANGALVSEAVVEAVTAATEYVAAGGVTAALAEDQPPHETGDAHSVIARVHARGGTVVATGGCFDLLHVGHLATLRAARQLGDCLIVCLNSDDSVRALKGPDRPLTGQRDRARLLAALDCVDAVEIFDETTPDAVLARLRPDVWVKGGDYTEVPESEVLARWGGRTVIVPYLDGRSTTKTIAAARGVPK
jgi:D-beta-D-heptose 7-phosphate kinase/D-beta-D-heptose 1-phosphate adenosyltransferase